MNSSTYSARTTGLSFGVVGLLFGLPFAAILIFAMLMPSDSIAGNVVVSLLLALLPAVLTAACAVFLVRVSPSGIPGFVQGFAASLLAYLLFFVCLGIYGRDIAGVMATGLHLFTIAPILFLFPVIGGITGIILKRKAMRA